MKSMVILQLVCLIGVFVHGSPPLPGSYDEGSLSENCRTPKCPSGRFARASDVPHNLPYPMDCLLYVACRGPDTLIQACPDGLVFNKRNVRISGISRTIKEYIGHCDTPENAKCVPCWQQTPFY